MLDQYSKHVAQQNLQEDTFWTSLIYCFQACVMLDLYSKYEAKQNLWENTFLKFLEFEEHCYKYLSCLLYIVENK